MWFVGVVNLLSKSLTLQVCHQVPTSLWMLYREWVDDVIDGQADDGLLQASDEDSGT